MQYKTFGAFPDRVHTVIPETETLSAIPFTTYTTSRATFAPSSSTSEKSSYTQLSHASESIVISLGTGAAPSPPELSLSQESSIIPTSSLTVSPSSPSSTISSTNHRTNGTKWAMTYTPYTSTGTCKSASAISADIALIATKGFTTVRLYAPDCSGLQHVGAACASHGLHLIAGIYIDESGVAGARPQVQELVSWSQDNGGRGWAGVEMVVVGNEAVFQGFCTTDELAGFVGEVRDALRAEGVGYEGPVTTTETLETLQENSGTLCPVVDVVGANIHPFFNSDCDADGAGTFVKSGLVQLKDVCPGGKEYYNFETGWPSRGSSDNGAAVPGAEDQKTAVQGIVQEAGERSVMFSFENDVWKEPGEFGVEQFWGCSEWF